MTEDPQALLQSGLAAAKSKNYDEAIRLLSQANSLAPNNANILTPLGFAYYRKTDHANAQEYLQQTLTINPNQPKATEVLEKITPANQASSDLGSTFSVSVNPNANANEGERHVATPQTKKREPRARKERREPTLYELKPIRWIRSILIGSLSAFLSCAIFVNLYSSSLDIYINRALRFKPYNSQLEKYINEHHKQSLNSAVGSFAMGSAIGDALRINEKQDVNFEKLNVFNTIPQSFFTTIENLRKVMFIMVSPATIITQELGPVITCSLTCPIVAVLAITLIRAYIRRRRFLTPAIILVALAICYGMMNHQSKVSKRRINSLYERVLQGQSLTDFETNLKDYLGDAP